MNRMSKKTAWIFFLSFFALEVAAYAATYNFYFNNTEQGDNSTATPNVVIGDGKKEGGKGLKDALAPEKPASSDAAPAAQAAPSNAASSVAAVAQADGVGAAEFRHFRLAAGVADLLGDSGGSLNLGYFFNREIGFNVFGGVVEDRYGMTLRNGSYGTPNSFFFGAELEVTPVRISVGRMDDLLDLGGVFGVSTIAPDDGNWVSPHIGARLNVNLGSRWGLTTTARFNASYALAEIGLIFRL